MPAEIKHTRNTRVQIEAGASGIREGIDKVKAGIFLVDVSTHSLGGETPEVDDDCRAEYMDTYHALVEELDAEYPTRARGVTPSPPPAEYDSEAMKAVRVCDTYGAALKITKRPFDFEGHDKAERRFKASRKADKAARRTLGGSSKAGTSKVKGVTAKNKDCVGKVEGKD